MEFKDFKTVAGQLRKPHGALGKETGEMMNKGNKLMNLAAIGQLEISARWSDDTIKFLFRKKNWLAIMDLMKIIGYLKFVEP